MRVNNTCLSFIFGFSSLISSSVLGLYEAHTTDLTWNTFMGSSSWDQGNGIAVDQGGNVFIVGESSGNSWLYYN